MHQAILQQLAAEHIKDMIVEADYWRRANQVRRARPAQAAWPRPPRSRTEAAGLCAGSAGTGSPVATGLWPKRLHPYPIEVSQRISREQLVLQ
jgi:hypothetical protein